MSNKSSGERTFLYWWGILSGCPPPPAEEFRFHPTRKWRFDFAWEAQMTAVEIDGGTWLSKHGKKGGHTTGVGYQRNAEKLNAAVALGWRILRYTPAMLDSNPVECVEQIKQVLDIGDMSDGTPIE